MSGKQKIVIALDNLSLQESIEVATSLGNDVYAYKIHSLWDEQGPGVVAELKRHTTAKLWADLKLHDIPHTVGLRAAAVKQAGIHILTVHASGGVEMMKQAVQHGPGEIYAVTVLTSLSQEDLRRETNFKLEDVVRTRAQMAIEAGAHGIVCSGHEVAMLRSMGNFKLVVPGTRSVGVAVGDQKRVMTPSEALKNGADLIVIGRQIIGAADRKKALDDLAVEIQ